MADVLVVDGDAQFQAAAQKRLAELGHGVRLAASAEELLREATNRVPDVVVMDMQFPGGGAPYAAKLLETQPALAVVPIILASAMPVEQMKRWFPESPRYRYCLKPADFARLDALIRELSPQDAQGGVPVFAPVVKQAPLAGAIAEALKTATKQNVNEVASRLVDFMLADAMSSGASDVHLDSTRDSVFVRYRIDGILESQGAYPKAAIPMIARLRVMANLSPAPPANPVPEESSFDIPLRGNTARARLSTFPGAHGERLAIRLLGQSLPQLDQLGFFPDMLEKVRQVIRRRSGIIFVSGQTGNGKTTTLCALLQTLSAEELNVMTLEDPVEYNLPKVHHAQINPASGFTFAQGLKAMMRQDPNVIMVGEVRDQETAETALRAAMTGHLVLTTIHATSAPGVLSRLLGMGIEPFLLCNAPMAAIYQRLARKVCAHCAQPVSPDPALAGVLVKAAGPQQGPLVQSILSAPGGKFSVGKGCELCAGSGAKGRTGLFEVLTVDDGLRELILAKPGLDDILKRALQSGMRTLFMDAAAKAWNGWVSLTDVAAASA